MTTKEGLAKRFLRTEWERLSTRQRRVVTAVMERTPVARDATAEFADGRTFGQRLADRIALFGGSWTFIIIFLVLMLAWAALNSWILASRSAEFDPYPYVFLNLMLSMLASLQAPMILMSQGRQAARDRLEASADYEVNLKAEIEIHQLHEKLDALREAQWNALVLTQERQIELLERLLAERDSRPAS